MSDPEETPEAAQDPRDNPNVAAMNKWDAVIGDMEATAEEYEQEGWDALQLHPGDIAVLAEGGRLGFDVLVPNDEYEAVEALFESGVGFDEYQVYRAVSDDMVYLLVVMRDSDTETAVLFPLYYRTQEATGLFEAAREEGVLRSYLRRLDGAYVELEHSDPDLFAPPGDGDA